jgi:ABC-type amino acid transport substrate-binding protein
LLDAGGALLLALEGGALVAAALDDPVLLDGVAELLVETPGQSTASPWAP